MLAAPARAQDTSGLNSAATTQTEADLTETTKRNLSSFRMLDWRPYFSNTRNGAILVDIDSRAEHYWSEDQSIYKLYPSSVPLTEDLTRSGRPPLIKTVDGPRRRPATSASVRPAAAARLLRLDRQEPRLSARDKIQLSLLLSYNAAH